MVPVAKFDQYIIDFVIKLRKDRGLTQQDIATIINSSQQFVGNVESLTHPSKYNTGHINLMADHFGISPREFLPNKALF